MKNKPKQDVSSAGRSMYRKVLGKDPLNEDSTLVGIREFTVNHLFANIWTRSNDHSKLPFKITLRERRFISIALLAAQGFSEQLAEHAKGALADGVNEAELLEVMIHVAHYAGWPAGTNGQNIIRKTHGEYLERKK
jgi:4-carboxymuconolactone decarboxylase